MTPVITVDGPSGAGKGTLCQWLSQKLGWELLDSGALYRLTALRAQQLDIPFSDEQRVADVARHLDIHFEVSQEEGVIPFLKGEDVSLLLRTEEMASYASQVASINLVREALLERQRAFRKGDGLVADGRDMGTVVFKDAPLKIFLTASAQERANRRHRQLKNKGLDVNIATLINEIEARDQRDMNRSASPSIPAIDAIQIDSTGQCIEIICNQVWELVKEKGLA